MASNIKLTYHVDIVFCIDCTESMDNVLNIVKSRALAFHDDIQTRMQKDNKVIDRLRIRVVAFRDYRAYDEEVRKELNGNEPMLITDFMTLPEDNHKLEVSVKSLFPIGGGDKPEDGLEALAYAIRSDWSTDSTKTRHIIVLWTDQVPHELGFGKDSTRYPHGMARDLNELTEWWGDKVRPGYMPHQSAKRIILFSPAEGAWETISENWDNVIHLPSKAGDHLRDVDYETILNCIAHTIS